MQLYLQNCIPKLFEFTGKIPERCNKKYRILSLNWHYKLQTNGMWSRPALTGMVDAQSSFTNVALLSVN